MTVEELFRDFFGATEVSPKEDGKIEVRWQATKSPANFKENFSVLLDPEEDPEENLKRVNLALVHVADHVGPWDDDE